MDSAITRWILRRVGDLEPAPTFIAQSRTATRRRSRSRASRAPTIAKSGRSPPLPSYRRGVRRGPLAVALAARFGPTPPGARARPAPGDRLDRGLGRVQRLESHGREGSRTSGLPRWPRRVLMHLLDRRITTDLVARVEAAGRRPVHRRLASGPPGRLTTVRIAGVGQLYAAVGMPEVPANGWEIPRAGGLAGAGGRA